MATLPALVAVRPSRCCKCGAGSSGPAIGGSSFFRPIKLPRGLWRMGAKDGGLLAEVNLFVDRRSRVFALSQASLWRKEKTPSTGSEINVPERASTYLFRTEFGGSVKVSIRRINGKYITYIEAASLELVAADGGLVLNWGIYRSDSASFISLDSRRSASDARTLDTPFVQSSSDRFALELEFEAIQTPFYLSFMLKCKHDKGSSDLQIKNHKKENFCVPIGFDTGRPAPLGLSFSGDGSMNFALFSRNAKGVVLCLFDDHSINKPALELDLDPIVNRSGDIWHASLEGAWNFSSYGYRCKDTALQDNAHHNAGTLLLDPYAKVTLNFTVDSRSGLLPTFLGRISKEPSFDWSGDLRPNLPMEKLVVYRLNVARFTKERSNRLSTDVSGTFAGVIEKLNHLKYLGVNAVLLEPVFPFNEEKGPYFPCHFFSPSNQYGPSGDSISAISTMKEMVKTLHANGIEVLMEVVFTHTSESGSLHGIDDSCYYHANKLGGLDSRNALNCNFPIVQRMILDSLHHWVMEFHIDGFCFVNAFCLLKGLDGETLSRPPIVEAIAFDPLLSKTKIIADSWDPQNTTPKEAHFPHWKRWAEINSQFCYDVRNFFRGESPLSSLATRLCGSGDIFFSGRGPAFSFNYIARNFGLPLVDLVSFSDGELASESSWNCGEEGPTNKTAVLERRLKQIRNYIFVLFVSLGIPVLNMGDECGLSTGGSISYSDRKPFDWSLISTGFGQQTTQFISFLSALRSRRSDLFQKSNFLKEENIDWHGPDQSPPKWDDPASKFLAVTLRPDELESELDSDSFDIKGDLFMAFNAASCPEIVILPPIPKGFAWRRLVDTALPFPGFFSVVGEPVVEQMTGLVAYEMKSHSCILFEVTKSIRGLESNVEASLL